MWTHWAYIPAMNNLFTKAPTTFSDPWSRGGNGNGYRKGRRRKGRKGREGNESDGERGHKERQGDRGRNGRKRRETIGVRSGD